MSDTARLTRTEQVESTVARCCWNAAAMLRIADNSERDAGRRLRKQRANAGQAELLSRAAEIADEMLAALKHAEEAIAWYDAARFEMDGKKVGDVINAAVAKAEGRTP